MFYPSLKDFLKLSSQGNVIPIYKEINADLDTPVSAFLRIKKNAYAFLLESVEGQEKIARYSFLGSNPSLVFRSKARQIEIIRSNGKKIKNSISDSSPLDELKKIMKDFKAVKVPGLPRFYGGLVGFMGYDSVRFFEEIPDNNPDDLKLPDAVFILTDTVLIFDHINHTIKIVNNLLLPKGSISKSHLERLYAEAVRKIEAIEKDFNKGVSYQEKEYAAPKGKVEFNSNFKRREFENIVERGKRHIKKGDIIQVVLSQRFKAKIQKEPLEIYRTLRSLNPSPYMYFLQLKDFAIVGASPEMLVRCEDGLVETRPIAGTRCRGRSGNEDDLLAKELIKDKKERAEHLMLVDLGRNDLGRVCKSGSVKVGEFMSVERYSHVMHLVSEVKGCLDKKRYDVYDVLKAAFPAGTVSGSPKIRAMEIIDELENLRRGPYAGCVGYFSFSHNMDTCITIRTLVIKGGYAYVQAGAGIVADSVAQKEYVETVNKARALMEAITK